MTKTTKVAIGLLLIMLLMGAGYLVLLTQENASVSLNPSSQLSQVSTSAWEDFWCDVRSWFGSECQESVTTNPTVTNTTQTSVVVSTSTPIVVSTTTIVQNIVNEYVTNPVEIVRETFSSPSSYVGDFVTRQAYDAQIEGLMSSIENSGDDDVNNIEDLYDVASMTETLGDLFTWNGTAWTNAATSSLGINSSQWTTSGSDIYYDTGNVRIGTDSPTAKLTVAASATLGSELVTNGTFTGDADGWDLQSGCSAYDDNNVTVIYDAGCQGDAGWPALSTEIELVDGVTYILSLVVASNGDQPSMYFDNLSDADTFGDGYHTFEFTSDFTGTETIYFESDYYTENAGWTIDNVSLRSISDASTAVTLYDALGKSSASFGGLSDVISIGSNAGFETSGAYKSNFLGQSAGYGATNAHSSNFFGYGSGAGASDAYQSNFMGVSAGAGASDAYQSNFFGYSSGQYAINASESNFLGYFSGYGATDAEMSNFIGSEAGFLAVEASESNFFGRESGYNSTNANNSNFFGYRSGYGATNAYHSNFFGPSAGRNATNAYYSNFIGSNAGNEATNAAYSIFIGYNAGTSDSVNNTGAASSSIAIGRNSGTGGFSDSIALGHGVINSAARQLNIGNVLYATGLYTSDTQTATPQSIGRVGIGTSTPLSKLTVYGDALLEGSSRYLNFGTATGTSGYGFRDNAGTMEFKDSGDDWTALSSLSGTIGTSWTARSAAGNNDFWNSVTYGNGLFVAVSGFGDRIMTSPDGINWTIRSAAGNDDSWRGVAYGNGLFVAVGSGSDMVMTSPDGINWTVRSAAGDNDSWRGITYGNGLFVAVGVSGDRVITSPDGINWTARSAADNNDAWYSVTYGNGLFVAVGTGVDMVMTSTDGTIWTARSAAGNDDGWQSITYGNGLFVAVGHTGDFVMTSPDGTSWTARSAAGDNDEWYAVTYGNGLYVAVGSSGDRVMTSPDGINWTIRSAAGDNDSWRGITYGNGLFVAVSQNGDHVMTSGKSEISAFAHNNLYQGGLNIMGNVGIGTTTGASKLHIIGTAGNTNALTVASSTGSSMLTIDATGNATFVGSGGTCTINGSGACSSDERLKTGFEALDNESALENLMTLRVGTYKWADTTWDQSVNIGVLAQDLLATYPELVGQASTTFMGITGSYYTVNYAGLTVPIIAAIKELNLKLEDLTATTTLIDLESDSFTSRFFNRLVAWFADAANGIGTMVANTFLGSELCLQDEEGTTCYTRGDLDAVVNGRVEEDEEEPVEEIPEEEEVVEEVSEEELPLEEELIDEDIEEEVPVELPEEEEETEEVVVDEEVVEDEEEINIPSEEVQAPAEAE